MSSTFLRDGRLDQVVVGELGAGADVLLYGVRRLRASGSSCKIVFSSDCYVCFISL